jgi:hypothetical protein
MARWRPFGWAQPARLIRGRIDGASDLQSYLDSTPFSLWEGVALAVFVSGFLALAFGRLPSRRANWAIALLSPALIAPALYWVLLRFAGSPDFQPGALALLFILPWYLASAATLIFTRMWRARN